MTRPASKSVMSEGRRGSRGSGGFRSERRAVGDADQIGAERAGFRLDLGGGQRLLERRDHFQLCPLSSAAASAVLGALLLRFLEFLQLPRHHAFIAFGPDPAPVPVVEAGDVGALRAVVAIALAERDLLRCLFRDRLLRVGEMGVIVVADRADGEAARTIAERADDAQQSLPEAVDVARARHLCLSRRRRVDEALEELQDGGEAELLRLGGAGALVDAEMQHGVGRTGVEAAAA